MNQLLPLLRRLLQLGIICSFWHSSLSQDVASLIQLQNSPQQKTNEKNQKSLKQVLQELQNKHHVSFVYNTEAVQDKFIASDIKLSGTLTESLRNLLNPLKLHFEKINDGLYVITAEDEEGSSYIKRTPGVNPDENPQASAGRSMVQLIENLKLNNPHLISTLAAITITGKVTDDTNTGLPGVNVLLKGTNTGTTTNGEGNYSLSIPDGSANGTLIFSYIGYTPEEVPINGRTNIDISLVPDVQSLSEVVVVGYGTQKRSDLTGAVASVKGEDIKNLPVADLNTALQGRVPGALITQNDGRPGAGSSVILRGPVSINGGDPLYVVDGVPVPGGLGYNFNIQDIESIEVLKDASAAAIYGAQAGGGVILVTTKKGKAGRLSIGLNANFGVRNVFNLPQTLRRDEYIRAKQAFGFDVVDLYGLESGWSSLPDTDWFDEVYRQGMEQNYTLSLSGGGEKSTYFLSGNYNRIDGTRIGNWIERYTLRLNSDHQINKKLKFVQTFFAKYGQEDPDTRTNQGELSFRNTPVMPVYDPTNPLGGWGRAPRGFQGGHDVQSALGNVQDNENYEFFASGAFDYQIVKGLTARANLGTRFITGNNYYYNYRADVGTSITDETFGKSFYKDQNYVATLTLGYDRTFGQHSLKALVGYEARRSNFANVNFNNRNPLVPVPQSSGVVQNENTATTSFGQGDIYDRILSQFGRLDYTYADKYLLTFNIRRDGWATKFGPRNKFGVFPGISLGWKISEEPFMQSVPLLNFLKLRGGYGLLGNSPRQDFAFIGNYATGWSYDFGNGRQSSVSLEGKLPNPNIQWESVATTNFGVDGGLLENRITFNLDYYSRQTREMIYNLGVAPSAGLGGFVPTNIGQMSNKGFEFNIEYRDRIGEFTYSAGFNGAFNRNRLISLDPNLGRQVLTNGNLTELHDGKIVSRSEPGLPLGQFYGYQVDGIYQTDAASGEARPKIGDYVPQAGDLIYRDLNADGRINDDDKIYIGNPWPKFNYGINLTAGWKGFDIQVFFNGVAGNDIYNAFESYEHLFFSDYTTTSKIFETSGFAGNGVTDKPRVGTLSDLDKNGNWAAVSSYHVQNGSYLRLRNLQIGYTLPASLLSRARINSVRVFAMADNLLTITGYKGVNPDIGGDFLSRGIDNANFRYPISRLVSFGMNANF